LAVFSALTTASAAGIAAVASRALRLSVAMLKTLPLSKRTSNELPLAGPTIEPGLPTIAGGPRHTIR